MNSLTIKNGRVIDPANGVDAVRDVFVVDGKIASAAAKGAEAIDATGKIVTPGLIDMHVHLREPGRSDKETIETGTRCAARGGFTSVVCMPNTSPAADNTGTIAFIKQRAAEAGCVNVFPTGAITKELKGEELAPIGSLKKAGVVAITDDGRCVQNNELMRRAVEYSKMFDLPVLDHCQDYNLAADGVMNEGHWSVALGLRGWPAVGEDVIVARNILLAEQLDWHIHCQHISSARSVQLIRDAKKRGIKISGEACPHHFTLTDECVKTYDANFKMNPPVRTERDRAAILEGLADGTLEIIASDHAPHCTYEKEVEFDVAPFGIIGLETELALALELVRKNALDLPRLVETFTINPARLLRLKKGTLSVGADADVTVIDAKREWTYDVTASASKSRNSPFHGWNFSGRAVATIVAGEIVWRENGQR
ncbi:MAG TPA: dihydroorotase [Verrucomicrobiae bacterium]|nr:dihydroorotase [Verrucomicrobiae bacterium]